MILEKMAQLADHFEKEVSPRDFSMHMWVHLPRGVNTANLHHRPCGTTCCIAGEQVLLEGFRIVRGALGYAKFMDYEGFTVPPAQHAQGTLDLTNEQAQALFYIGNWPYGKRGIPMFPETSLGAAARIRHMMETGR